MKGDIRVAPATAGPADPAQAPYPGGPMRNYYVLRPERRCDRFDLRVRFSRQHLPAWVRRVEDEDVHSYNTNDDLPADARRVTVDLTGEATASFTRLRQHFGSGLQWGW